LGAVGLAYRATLRRRWRSWLAVAILISIVGGVVVATADAGRRTNQAFPDFVSRYGFTAVVYSTQRLPKLATLPDVGSATVLVGADTGQPSCNCTHPLNPNDFGIISLANRDMTPYKLVAGRLPNPSSPTEVVASYTLQGDFGIHLGSVIRVPFYAKSQVAAYNNAVGVLPKPLGPTLSFRVVGFEASQFEFPSGGVPSYDLFVSSEFARNVMPKVGSDQIYFVQLRHGPADLARFDTQAAGLGGQVVSQAEQVSSVEAAIHPQAVGWWILALLSALVGLAVIGQALARQSLAESEDYPTLTTLGFERRQLLALGAARNLTVAVAGALGVLVVATVLSPVAPLGEARIAAPSTGLTFDASVLLLGALLTILVVLVLGTGPVLRTTRSSFAGDNTTVTRPSKIVGQMTVAGAPPSALIGVRNALERRTGTGTLPSGAAFLGTVLAVTALCATSVFGASLHHLTSTPNLYGVQFQLNFTDPNGGGPDAILVNELRHDRVVTGITAGYEIALIINHVPVSGIAGTPLRGPLLLTAVSGHDPATSDEIGLGATTMRQVGAHLGSIVDVTVSSSDLRKRTAQYRVVSAISFPVLSGVVSLGNGAAVTLAGYVRAACPPGPKETACAKNPFAGPTGGGLLVSVAPGRSGHATVDHYLNTYASDVALPTTPTSLVNFGEAVNFPLIFGIILAVFGAATLAHFLIVSVSRRRREIGLLKALGFVRSQVASTVIWQASTITLVGLVIGLPLGIVIGKGIWILFATNLGVVPVPWVQLWVVAALAAGVIVVANLLALGPAVAATRAKPGELLRTP